MKSVENGSGERNTVHDSARSVFVVAGIFSLVVAVVIGINYIHTSMAGPLDSPVMAGLKEEYLAEQTDKELAEQIRALDLLSRRAFFSSTSFARVGGYMLLGGLAVMLISFQVMVFLRERTPDPGKYESSDNRHKAAAMKRRSVALSAVIVIVAVIIMTVMFRSGLRPGIETDRAALGERDVTVEAGPNDKEIAKQWPGFRGPFGLGRVRRTSIPLKWDGNTGLNILWKTRIPKPGFNSPVVWNDRVFMSGADKDSREVYCFDGDTGKLSWTREVGVVPGSPPELPEVSDDTGFAAPTVAVDGRRVFAIFATGNIVSLDFDGNRQWARHLRNPANMYGHASSLITHGGMVFVQIDDDDGRHLLGLDAESGRTVWEETNEQEPCWSSPILARIGGKAQLVLNGNPLVCGYDPMTGDLIWEVECMSGDVAPSPASDGGLVFATMAYAVLAAIKPEDGARIVWQTDEGLPDVSSPAAADGLLYVPGDGGVLTCYEAASGAKLWKKEFDEGFYSSPVIVNGRVFLTDLKGVTVVFKAGREYEQLAKNELGEAVSSTPAFVNGRIYIRGQENLFCVEAVASGQ